MMIMIIDIYVVLDELEEATSDNLDFITQQSKRLVLHLNSHMGVLQTLLLIIGTFVVFMCMYIVMKFFPKG